MMDKIRVNDPIPPRELTTIQGKKIAVPTPGFRTHLQFRRFAGCAGCNLHLRPIAQRYDEALKYGIHAYDQWLVDQLLGIVAELAHSANLQRGRGR